MRNASTIIALLFAVCAFLIYRWGEHEGQAQQPALPPVQVSSSIESIKNLGQLLVMKAALKEIVTAELPYNRIPVHQLATPKKIAIIFKFDVNFKYDLRDRSFSIASAGAETVVHLPPVKIETAIRDIHIYDKQPGTAGIFWNTVYDISKEEENDLIQQARNEAEHQVEGIKQEYCAQYQSSAAAILKLLAEQFGNKKVRVEFEE